MAQPLACPSCSRSLSIPDDSAGKRLRCPSCQSMLRITGGDEGLALELVEAAPAPTAEEAPQATAPAVEPSPARTGSARAGSARAGRAGGRRGAAAEPVAPQADEDPKGLLERPHLFLLLVGILLFVTGFWAAHEKQSYLEKQLGDKAYAPATDIIKLDDGNRYRVGAVRKPYEDDIMFTKITYFGLGIMMIAMFWWARAAAFPALVTALGGFGIVFFLLGLKGAINGDFTTLIEYWYVKVVAVLVLLYGIRLAKHQHIALVQSGRYQSRRRPPSRGGRDAGAAKAAP